MTRPIRMDYADTFYHVLSRGNERRDIFYDPRDYEIFLEFLGEMVDRFKAEIHAYVLMKNHYHLLIHTKDANLSKAIQWLGVSYSVSFNRRHNRSGHLFQGRFKSFLIENERYFTTLCLYIHGNPLRAGQVKKLSDYPWSSYKSYENEIFQVPWLTTDLVLGVFQGSRQIFCAAHKEYIEKEKDTILENLKHGLYLGSDAFAQECIQRAKIEKHQEKPQLKSLEKDKGLLPLIQQIFNLLGENDFETLMRPTKIKRPNKDIAIYILSHLGIFTNKEIAGAFGIGYTAISGAVKRGKGYLDTDERLRKIVQNIFDEL